MKHKLKEYIGYCIIAVTIFGMLALYAHQRKNYVDYSPDFPVYRSADTSNMVFLKNEVINTGQIEAKQQRSMDTNVILQILGTIGIFATIIFNPQLAKIRKKQDDDSKENRADHDYFKREFKNYGTISSIETDLRAILAHNLEVSPEKIQGFINFEGENNIKFCRQILHSKFDYTQLEAIKAKICAYSMDALNEIDEIKHLPQAFKEKFAAIQKENTDYVYQELANIVYDNTFNSKHTRFKLLMTQILNKHLHQIIEIYNSTR